MMNLPVVAAVTLFVMFVLLPYPVAGDRVVRFLFNDGKELASGQTCDDSDLAKIEDIFNPIARRHLRSDSANTFVLRGSSIHSRTMDRELPYFPRFCKQNCAGFKSGLCLATSCKGYRRNNRILEHVAHARSLFTCSEEITEIHQQLDSLISSDSISYGCEELLRAPRNATCYEDVIFGEVKSFTFWKNLGNNDEILQTNAPNGMTICNSTSLNIEAVVNSCVDVVKFLLTGPNQYSHNQSEYAVPYTVFGDFNSNFNGRTLHVGNYTLEVLPDKIAAKRKTLKFQISNC